MSAISYTGSAWIMSVLLALTSPVQGNEETSMKQASVASKELQQEVTFDQDIFPLFDRNCLVCHGPSLQRAGLNLRSQESVLRGSANGPVIKPGNAQESLLYQLITHQKEPAMPMGGKLGENEITTIANWINSLPPLERLPESGHPVRESGSAVTEQDCRFWFPVRPLRPVPRTDAVSWGRNELDAFVLQKLESKDLRPTPRAEPVALQRRAYSLLGLPPSAEVLRFDPSG